MSLRGDVARLRARVAAILLPATPPLTLAEAAELERDVMARLEDAAAVARDMTTEQLIEELAVCDAMAAAAEREWNEPRASAWSTRARSAFLAELVARGVDVAEFAKIDEQLAQHGRAAQETQ